ncbi:MAG: DEAD/DEAH box helicase [Actinomycetota bacterium]
MRAVPTAPFAEARIFQVGAVRLGRDRSWVRESRCFSAFLSLPEGFTVHAPDLAARHAAAARPAGDVLEDLRTFCSDADTIVAYNGVEHDFPLLDAAYEREGRPGLDRMALVDGYLIALLMWPTPPRQHRLGQLAERLGLKVAGLRWHDALDDAKVLALLLGAAGRALRALDPDLRRLVASVSGGSHALELVFDLAKLRPAREPRQDADVADLLGRLMLGRPRRREPPPERDADELALAPQPPLDLPPALAGPSDRVRPVALARAAGAPEVTERPQQEQMATILSDWVAERRPGLVEAPTGSGKSFALLAQALDWLRGDSARRVLISTHTKQLQGQLARDIEALAAVVPALGRTADLVKGRVNRLSLRALVAAVGEATRPPALRAGPAPGFASDERYREFLAFLMLRLVAPPTTLAEAWEARSLDPVDVPAFFESYLHGRSGLYLASLSQEAVGEFGRADREITLHTDTVREAIAGHRLIVANHALLLARREDLTDLGPETLLLVDEAHSLEGAATGALSAELDYAVLERLTRDAVAWADQASGPTSVLAAIRRIVADLDEDLATEKIPKVALEILGRDAGARTIASPYAGPGAPRRVDSLRGYLATVAQRLDALSQHLYAYGAQMADRLDPFAAERFWSLAARIDGARDALASILVDLEALLGPLPSARAREGDAAPEGARPQEQAAPVPTAEGAQHDEDDEESGAPDEVDSGEEAAPDGDAPPEVPEEAERGLNRVVYLEPFPEPDLARGRRSFRFRIVSAPISLGAEPAWSVFQQGFPRRYLVSATLRVAGSFDYIRDRLALGPEVAERHLDTPFDLARQARLVCMSDFPSWAEQPEGAMRTLAHQLAGYVNEVVRRTSDGTYAGGAMVLTTSRAAAAGIAGELAARLAAAGQDAPVHATALLGNQRGVDAMRTQGGVLVGTKGLWQGVDIANPERLRLVIVNKLPFAPFADPLVIARRARERERAEREGAGDPDQVATERFYLPQAALELRQAVGRLIRSERHQGVVVICDRKLAGTTRQRELYRRIFLGSLDPGLLRDAPALPGPGGGCVVDQVEGWRRIWEFLTGIGLITADRAAALTDPEALREHTLLPATRRIADAAMTEAEVAAHRAAGTLSNEIERRGEAVAGWLKDREEPLSLRAEQRDGLAAVAQGEDLLALLPTGYGKSFLFQLPALILPGLTLVVSPLVSLMHDQAMELNRSIGGAVRALVGSLPESSSRMGRAEVAEQMAGTRDHGIRLVYCSPERLCQAPFQALVAEAVAAGRITRIAIDEAHTLVQWGDDFRPAFRRMERFLAELRAGHPTLRLTAVTATANRTVREGLRERIFGRPATPPPGGDGPGFRQVAANPLRPEIALYRRVLATGQGAQAVAGLVEAVVDAADDHAIFYCLTVREVEAVHAAIREYLGPGEAGRVRMYHGRLPEIEKAAVANDFRASPRRGEEGFAPMIVVATSAFGLGIDRPDIRLVFVVSPPPDLAALYQQLGRAGRDCAGWVPGAEPGADAGRPVNVGLALATRRSINLVQWMTQQDLPAPLLRAMGERVLAATDHIDPLDVARDLIAAELNAGRLTPRAARSPFLEAEWRSGVVRVLAALAGAGLLEDGGDFPERVKILPGEIAAPAANRLVATVIETILAQGGGLRAVRLPELHARLAALPGYAPAYPDPARTWVLLQDLHVAGHLDVSQAPNDRTLIGCRPLTSALPAGFTALVGRRLERAARELRELVDWLQDDRCTAAGLVDYLSATLPPGTCALPTVRCSTCWGDPATAVAGEVPGAIHEAFFTPRPAPAAAGPGRPQFERRLDEAVERLLWDNWRGLAPVMIRLVLAGADSYYDRRAGRRRTLWPRLLHHRLRGSRPGLRQDAVDQSLERLRAAGAIVDVDQRVRLRRHADAEEAQRARAAAAGGAS